MMRARLLLAAAAVSVALGGSACIDQNGNVTLPTSPTLDGTPTTPGSLTGLWAGNGQASVDNCHGIQWNVTSQTATSLSGTFSAICANIVTISGTASGTVNGQNVTMQVSGVASVQGVVTTCPFSLQGTGVIQGNNESLLVNYTGTTCLGPVSGQELLRR
jgi:hypothetical protein